MNNILGYLDNYFNFSKLPKSGSKPLYDTPPPPPPSEELTAQINGYIPYQDGFTFNFIFVQKSIQIHTYKKSYLAQWLATKSKLNQFEQLVSADDNLKVFWIYCTEFDSNHPLWTTIKTGVQLGLGLTDQEMDEFLRIGENGFEN